MYDLRYSVISLFFWGGGFECLTSKTRDNVRYSCQHYSNHSLSLSQTEIRKYIEMITLNDIINDLYGKDDFNKTFAVFLPTSLIDNNLDPDHSSRSQLFDYTIFVWKS